MYEYTILLYLLYTTHVHMQCAFEVDQLPTRINICLVSRVSQLLVFRFAFRVTFLFLILFIFFITSEWSCCHSEHTQTHTHILDFFILKTYIITSWCVFTVNIYVYLSHFSVRSAATTPVAAAFKFWRNNMGSPCRRCLSYAVVR